MERERVVVAGASGCVGRGLVGALLQDGCHVLALCRHPGVVAWPQAGPGVLETIAVDIVNAAILTDVLAGTQASTAYYLIHSMGGGISDRDRFIELDQTLARNFSNAARLAGIGRIIYLGGHLPDGEPHSEHLRSRTRVGTILERSGATVTQLRAGVVIDLESAAFRMLASIIEKQSTLLIPPQFQSQAHPISLADAVETLSRSRELEDEQAAGVYDIGCPEPCRYDDLIRWYAEAHGAEPRMVSIPWAPREVIVPYVAGLTGEDFGLVWALSGSWGVDLPLHNESLYDILPGLPRTSPRQAVLEAVSASERRTQIHPSRRARSAS